MKKLRINRVFVLSFICLVYLSQMGAAQTSLGSVEEAWQIALQNNPNTKIYQQRISQANLDHKTSKSFWYPTVSLNSNGQHNLQLPQTPVPGELFGVPGTTALLQFGQAYNYQTGLNIQYEVWNRSKISEASVARQQITVLEAQEEVFVQDLKNQITELYYQVLLAQKSIEIQQKDLQLADSLVFLTEQKLSEGLIDRLAFNQSLMNQRQIQQSLLQNQLNYNQALENLKFLLGLKTKDIVSIQENWEKGTQEDPTSTDMTDKNLLVYQEQKKLAELQYQKAKANFKPRLSLYGYFGQQQFRDDFGLSLNGQDWNAYQYIGFNLALPLFTGFANKYQKQKQGIAREIAQAEYQNALQKQNLDDYLLIQNLQITKELAKSAENIYLLSSDNLQLIQEQYKEELIALDEYLQAFEKYLDAENAYLNRLAELFTTQSKIKVRQP